MKKYEMRAEKLSWDAWIEAQEDKKDYLEVEENERRNGK